MVLTPWVAAAALFGFAAASFFFALAESALFALGNWQVRQLAAQEPLAGGRVAKLLTQPDDLLAMIVLGNTVANSAQVIVLLTVLWSERWPFPPEASIVSLLLFILLVCEVLPKTLAVRAPRFWSLRVARPAAVLLDLSRPVLKVAQRMNAAILRFLVPRSVESHRALTDEDYRELFELGYQQGTLARIEKEIILEIIRLDRRTAKDVMKPRAQMACVPDDMPLAEMITAARRYRHRRLPIFDETPDTIVGILKTRELLLEPEIDLAEAIEFPSFVPETMNLLQLFKSLQHQQRGLAIVLDEFGTTAGIVTMEDVLEEMVGEIRREGEAEGFVMERLGPGRWRVNGTMRIEDFLREYPGLGEPPEVDTMGGLLTAQLEVVPRPGESAQVRGLRLTALVADERRVREVLVETVKRKGDGAV